MIDYLDVFRRIYKLIAIVSIYDSFESPGFLKSLYDIISIHVKFERTSKFVIR